MRKSARFLANSLMALAMLGGSICAAVASESPMTAASTPVPSANGTPAHPVQVALNDSTVARTHISTSIGSRPANGGESEPKDWMLLLLGGFLIAAISHRRVRALED